MPLPLHYMFAVARRDANTCRLTHESQIEFKRLMFVTEATFIVLLGQ